MTVAGSTSWRWLAPAGVLVIAALLAGGIYSATARSDVPHRSIAQILAALRSAPEIPMSGTMVSSSSLARPGVVATTSSGQRGAVGLGSGTHSARVWSDGTDRLRVSLLEPFGEIDQIRSGATVWTYDSATRSAVESTALRTSDTGTAAVAPVFTSAPVVTPPQIAHWAAAAADPATNLSGGSTGRVAGRTVYRIRLTPPPSSTTLVAAVELAVDVDTSTALAAKVYARGSSRSVLSVTFTDVVFRRPAATNFRFVAPSGSTVSRLDEARGTLQAHARGWATVLTGTTAATNPAIWNSAPLQQVQGPWGKGELVQTPLVCAVSTTDGRAVIGDVGPEALYAALG